MNAVPKNKEFLDLDLQGSTPRIVRRFRKIPKILSKRPAPLEPDPQGYESAESPTGLELATRQSVAPAATGNTMSTNVNKNIPNSANPNPNPISTDSLLGKTSLTGNDSLLGKTSLNDDCLLGKTISEKVGISVLRNLYNFLGESPFYQQETDRVYWIDILKGTLNYWHRTTGQMGRWDLKQRIGCAVPVNQNTNFFLIATVKGPAIFDIRTEHWVHTYNNPEAHLINNRWNDGKCGPDGVFWLGSMNGFNTAKSIADGCKEGALYYLDGLVDKTSLKKRIDYVGLSNGIAWSKSGLFMYYIDSATQSVSEYHYIANDTKTGVTAQNKGRIAITLSRPHLIKIEPSKGTPDGCAMDSSDNLWIALWGGSAIEQYSVCDGTLLSRICLPDKYITSLAWFGPTMDKLFVTSAMSDSLMTILDNNSKSEMGKGRVYILDFSKTNIRGLPVNGFEMSQFRG